MLFKIKDPEDISYRTVVLFSEKEWHVDEFLMRPEDHLREMEPQESFEQLSKDKAAEHPAVPVRYLHRHTGQGVFTLACGMALHVHSLLDVSFVCFFLR